MENYGRRWIRLGRLGTECIIMDSKMTLWYETWWGFKNHPGTESNWMYCNVKVSIWNVMRGNEYDWICKQTEWIATCQYDMGWDENGIAFFYTNYWGFWSILGSTGNFLPRACRGRWRTGRLTLWFYYRVICWIYVTESLPDRIIFLMRTTRATR